MISDDKDNFIIDKLESKRKLTRNNGLTFDPNDLPVKKEMPSPALPQQSIKKDASMFHGASQATRAQIKKELKTLDPKKYGLSMKKYQMADLEKLFPGRFGGNIDHSEAKRTAYELYWEIKHKQGDSKNWRQIVQDKNKLKLLKDLADIDENLYKM